MKKVLVSILSILVSGFLQAQQEERVLPPSINQPSVNLFAPFVSGDAKTLVYLSDYADDGHHTMYFSTREGFEWEKGKEINKLINRPDLNFRGGYSLDYDGQHLYFTSRKSGLGGFDIWVSTRQGDKWGSPKNLGAPVNSKENDGSPVISPDGEFLYFMRCEQMNEYGGADNCRLMVSKWEYTKWGNPTELPENINTGNSQTPRILGDGETLIFSSDKFNGKGALDLYMAHKTPDGYADPVPLDFINGNKDDTFVSIPAKGRFVYISRKGPRNFELIEKLIPEEFRPEKVLRVKGKLISPEKARLLVFNTIDRNRLWNENISSTQEFSLALKEGSFYDLSVESGIPGYSYYSQILDLNEIGRIDRVNLEVSLNPLMYGDCLSESIFFDNSIIADQYTFELRRIADFIKQAQKGSLEFQIIQPNYREDSLQSEGLTEIRYDTLFTPENDSIYPINAFDLYGRKIFTGNDSLSVILPDDIISTDTTIQHFYKGDTIRYSLGDITFKPVYHNNRTEKQAIFLKDFMNSRGVDTLSYTFNYILSPADTTINKITQTLDDSSEKDSGEFPAKKEQLKVIFRESGYSLE